LYEKRGLDKYTVAVDIENSAVVISPLIPWNIAGTLPATVLAVGPGFIIYSVYLYMLPLVNLGLGRELMYSVGQRLYGKRELKG
jgi:NhaC family Na+:H+ antiporter